MSSPEDNQDVAMLECNDTLPDQNHHVEEPNKSPFASLPLDVPAEKPAIHAHGAKELRVQQEEEVAVAQAVVADDDDEDAVMATVVVDEEEDDVPIAELSDKKRKASPVPMNSGRFAKSTPKSKRKSTRPTQDRLAAAKDARDVLTGAVTRLPVLVSDTHVVRSFGRIQVESVDEESKYSSANALYPVGFSCDRYEFSPVHGRVLKMRCTIFNGKKLKETQKKCGRIPDADIPDGPVFRVMWGQGVDEDVDIVDYPYDVLTDSAHISDSGKVDAVAVPYSDRETVEDMEPEEGMRVRVRFERDAWYSGTIVSVGEEEYDARKRQSIFDIRIHYDDGSIEDTRFPDPDISIYLPGAEDGSMENGVIEIDELRGKPVMSVVGTSPLDAWGKALIKLGLIDEIMLQSALQARAVARVEGRAEAEEKLKGKKAQRQQAQARTQQRQAETPAGDKGDDSTGKKDSPPAEKDQDSEAPKDVQEAETNAVPTATVEPSNKEEGPQNAEKAKAVNALEEKAVVNRSETEKTADSDTKHVAADSTADSVKKDDTPDSTAASPMTPSGADHKENGKSEAPTETQPEQGGEESKSDEAGEGEQVAKEPAEPASETENELRRQVEQLQKDLASLQAEDRESSIALADARISAMGPFLINPFHERGPTLSQELQWLTTVIRKEKTKMGSTGNKRKIVTATDLLERNDTFFNGDIEALAEGLPGSEYCPSYVFQAFRAGGASAVSQAWVHEAKLRQERDREKQAKSAGKSKADESHLQEKELKRKRRDNERDARKRQKQGQMDEKKRARAEERMARLNVQVDERLFKEACFQREKVVLLLSKSLGKDFAVRRKAAEMVSEQSIIDGRRKDDPAPPQVSLAEIPVLGRMYDEDVLRVWDFFTTFGSTFLERGYLPSIPSLDSLQDAIDALRDVKGSQKSRSDAIEQLVQIAMALSHPLAATLTRYLFASLIALNPALQKDFGAAFFNEVNASANANDDSASASPSRVLPMDKMTWQEVARLTFLSDSLGEIGYSRQDSAHLLRGYRSGGHPNSKESKRLRRSEDYTIALLRQELSQREAQASPAVEEVSSAYKVRVNVPSRPSASPNSWVFYLHNVKALPNDSLRPMKDNVRKAIAALESADPKPPDAKSALTDLGRGLGMLDDVKSSDDLSPTDIQTCKKARRIFFRVLDRTSGEMYSSETIGHVVHRDDIAVKGASKNGEVGNSVVTVSSNRQRMGLLDTLTLSDKEFKKFSQNRGEYMAEALRLKQELNKGGVEEEDDDEDDDEDDADGDKKMPAKESNEGIAGKQPGADKKADQPEAASAEIVATAVPVENGDGNANGSAAAAPQEPEKNGKAEASTGVVASVVENGDSKIENEVTAVPAQPDKESPFDEFCADIPGAPELIRRCLAVLRTLCQTGSAEPFLFPVDPQSNPGYYEVILKPMCFREVGMRLRDAASLYVRQSPAGDAAVGNDDMRKEVVASIVAQFARNVRLIAQNSACYVNAGAMVVCAGEEMIRIFERLLLDWVLAPKDKLPPLEFLDDDHCVEPHPSDDDSLVLLCDGCEGKYNMSRLNPPVSKVPKGDWYCPRCVSGRSWESLDPRIGKQVKAKSSEASGNTADPANMGVIRRCVLGRPEGHNVKATLLYEVECGEDVIEIWTLSEVDKALADSGQPVEPIACVEAVAESPGYGLPTDRGVFNDLVPVPLNPRVSYTAGEAAVSSSVYRDTVAGSSALRLISPEEMTANEWLRLLVLLITKCSASELMQTLVGKMESESAEKMAKTLEDAGKSKEIHELLPSISDDEDDKLMDVIEDAEAESIAVAAKGSTDVGGEGLAKPVKAESVEEVDTSAMVVDASAVEVVADVEMEPVVVAEAATEDPDESASQEETEKAKRIAAFAEKDNRERAREDSIAAFCIKNELRPTVASFEEDVVSQVVESTLTTKEKGLSFQSCRCRGMVCDFCGLSDVALGSPLIRAPSGQEWNELMPHAARSRRTSLLAELPNKKRLAAVTIRVDGEIVSEKPEPHEFDGISDGGMTEFLPRNEKGFQSELMFREESGLPFVTGSLSAHECCAVAVHKTRKECLVKEAAEKEAYLVEWSNGMVCGRTLSLGKDANRRSYWRFKADSSLFVCANETTLNGDMFPRKLWYKFSKPEEIASLLYFLGNDGIVPELKRAFPVAARMLKTRKWTELLLKRRFPLSSKPMLTSASTDSSPSESVAKGRAEEKDEEADDDEQPYEENEDVLVESVTGKLLWDAKIVGVSKAKDSGKVNGYRVRYDEWSSRFDEWVDPFRVVERVENNIEVQAEMLEDAASLRDGVPPALDNMVAKKFLRAKDRARGSAPVPNFTEVAKVEPTASTGKKTLGMLKAALLLLEAALPFGAVDTSAKGSWRPSLASEWRSMVRSARGPSSLMRCLVLLESSLSLEWVDPHYSHLLSSLPIGWKAINEATVGSIALRIFVIDQGIQYDEVDR